MDKVCMEAWKAKALEVHSWYPIMGDVGEGKHHRTLEITKEYPKTDYVKISSFLDDLDEKEHQKEKEIYKRWAESAAANE